MGSLGYLAASIAIVLFGSNFVVTKKYPTGDGVFFQWVMCMGVWCVGLILWLYEDPTKHAFEPLAMLGGVLWCTGNIWAVTIIKCIGLGMGLLIWGSANMLVGWYSGRFGMFGLLTKQTVCHPGLNDAGVVVALVGLGLFIFVKPEEQRSVKISDAEQRLLPHQMDDLSYGHSDDKQSAGGDEDGGSFVDSWSPIKKRVFGVVMSLVSGVLYGSNFDPPQYVIDHADEHRFQFKGTDIDGHAVTLPPPSHSIHYAFPHFCGILLTSTVYMLAYAALKGNKPVVYPTIILPGFVSGIMWAIAQCSWFVANQELSFPVSFPLVTIGPGLVGALWGVFVYGEIKGTKNYIFLVAAFVVSIVAAVLISISKGDPIPSGSTSIAATCPK